MRSRLIKYESAKHELNEKLISASAHGKLEKCKKYIKLGADLNYKQVKTGNTPAHYAAAYNQTHIFTYLSKLPKFKAVTNNNGYTYLHIAATFGCDDMVKYLEKERICDPAAKNINIKTAAQLAEAKKHQDKIAKLGKQKESCSNNNATIASSNINNILSLPANVSHDYLLPRSIHELKNLHLHGNIITKLNLAMCYDDVTDEILTMVADNCPNLTELDLRSCNKITDTAIGYLASKASRLISLNLFYCTKLTDTAIESLAAARLDLDTLDLTFCHNITDKGIELIAKNLPNMAYLTLGSCNITDIGVKLIATNLHKMGCLNLNKCNKITNAGIGSIVANANNLPDLEYIYLAECAHIKYYSAAVKKLHNTFPQARIIGLDIPQMPNNFFANKVKASGQNISPCFIS